MTGKSYKPMSGEGRSGKGEVSSAVIKRMISVVLLVLAAMFGGVLAVMPNWAAFVTVFAYISAQAGLWMM